MKTEKRYEVYATAFHGGRLISRHSTQDLADAAARRWRGNTDCICGCAGVIDRGAGERPGTQAQQDGWNNPYAVGAI